MSYGASITDASSTVNLHGPDSQRREAPDLPALQPTKFELLINLKDRQIRV
jgi:hypothetical protein